MNDLELEQAYYNTRYIVADIILRVDKKNEQLDDLLIKNNCETYAFITAHNPLSQLMPENENKRRHEQLIAFIKKSEFKGNKFKEPTKTYEAALTLENFIVKEK